MPTRELIGKRKTEAMETPAKQPTLANYWHPIALAADVIEQPHGHSRQPRQFGFVQSSSFRKWRVNQSGKID